MTCIVGFIDKNTNQVYIGGDSAGVAGLDLTVRADEKVFKNGDYIFGFTSSFRMGQILRYCFIPPTFVSGDLNRFMCTTFVDRIRECFKDNGYARESDKQEKGGTFLVGYKGHLFTIEGDYQVGIPSCGYDAVGCGDQVAKGALYALTRSGNNVCPVNAVKIALEASEQNSAGVRSPFVIMDENGMRY